MRINIADCSATGLYFHGDVLNDVGVATLLKRLHGHRQLLQTNSLVFLGTVMKKYGRSCERDRVRNGIDVVNIEGQTGTTSLQVASFSTRVAADYELLIKALHSCNTNLISLDNMTHFEVAAGRFVKATLIKFQVLREKRLLEPVPADVDDILTQDIEYLLNAAEMRRYQAQSLHRRTQSQINLVSNFESISKVILQGR